MLGKLNISGATELLFLCYYRHLLSLSLSLSISLPSLLLSPPSFSPLPIFVPLPLSLSLSLSHTHTHTHTHTALQPVLNFPSQFYDVRVSGDSVFEVKRTRGNCRLFFQKLSLNTSRMPSQMPVIK